MHKPEKRKDANPFWNVRVLTCADFIRIDKALRRFKSATPNCLMKELPPEALIVIYFLFNDLGSALVVICFFLNDLRSSSLGHLRGECLKAHQSLILLSRLESPTEQHKFQLQDGYKNCISSQTDTDHGRPEELAFKTRNIYIFRKFVKSPELHQSLLFLYSFHVHSLINQNSMSHI